jgi:hypothetical protein
MADSESGYRVGPGRPPLHTRFRKGQSGNPGSRRTKSLPALQSKKPRRQQSRPVTRTPAVG